MGGASQTTIFNKLCGREGTTQRRFQPFHPYTYTPRNRTYVQQFRIYHLNAMTTLTWFSLTCIAEQNSQEVWYNRRCLHHLVQIPATHISTMIKQRDVHIIHLGHP